MQNKHKHTPTVRSQADRILCAAPPPYLFLPKGWSREARARSRRPQQEAGPYPAGREKKKNGQKTWNVESKAKNRKGKGAKEKRGRELRRRDGRESTSCRGRNAVASARFSQPIKRGVQAKPNDQEMANRVKQTTNTKHTQQCPPGVY